MQTTKKPEPPKNALNVDAITAALLVGFLFSTFIFIGFLALFYFPPYILPGGPELWAILFTVISAFMYLVSLQLDKRNKIAWFKVLAVLLAAFFVGSLCVFFDLYAIGLGLIAFIVVPGVICSVVCVSYPGYYTEISIRGKIVSVTIIAVFGFVAIAGIASIAIPDLGIKAGFMIYGIAALVLIPLSLLSGKSAQIQFICQSHRVAWCEHANHLELKKYFIVLFMYKICLGMVLQVYLVKTDIISPIQTWAIIGSVAALIAPFLGHLTDKKGRKLMFNLACALLALLFGLFAFTGQGSLGEWYLGVLLIGGVLIGVSYPAMLLSEYLIFQELSDDVSRLQTFAR
ncbi:MAG TPA: hypothetical protein VKK79_16780, partial [Candidatus Lokiarchaeia archaeon]|nr:hypothetical protein [Candidatus Lokiarchaeia archaeon]